MLIKGENAMPSDDIVKTILKRGYSIRIRTYSHKFNKKWKLLLSFLKLI